MSPSNLCMFLVKNWEYSEMQEVVDEHSGNLGLPYQLLSWGPSPTKLF